MQPQWCALPPRCLSCRAMQNWRMPKRGTTRASRRLLPSPFAFAAALGLFRRALVFPITPHTEAVPALCRTNGAVCARATALAQQPAQHMSHVIIVLMPATRALIGPARTHHLSHHLLSTRNLHIAMSVQSRAACTCTCICTCTCCGIGPCLCTYWACTCDG